MWISCVHTTHARSWCQLGGIKPEYDTHPQGQHVPWWIFICRIAIARSWYTRLKLMVRPISLISTINRDKLCYTYSAISVDLFDKLTELSSGGYRSPILAISSNECFCNTNIGFHKFGEPNVYKILHLNSDVTHFFVSSNQVDPSSKLNNVLDLHD